MSYMSAGYVEEKRVTTDFDIRRFQMIFKLWQFCSFDAISGFRESFKKIRNFGLGNKSSFIPIVYINHELVYSSPT